MLLHTEIEALTAASLGLAAVGLTGGRVKTRCLTPRKPRFSDSRVTRHPSRPLAPRVPRHASPIRPPGGMSPTVAPFRTVEGRSPSHTAGGVVRKVAQMSSEDEEVIHLPGDHGDLWRCKRGQTPERLPASQKVTLVMMSMKRRCWMQPRTDTDMTVRC